MGLFDKIFKKTVELPPASLMNVKVDMHSHLIPGVDDGARTTEDSIELIRNLSNLGYTHFVTTPHIMSDLYPNSKDDLRRRADKFREDLLGERLSVTLEVSAEYFLDDHFMDLLRKDELMPFGDNFILFEMSFMDQSPHLQEAIFELQSAGYRPILAHPERYSYMHKTPDKYEDLKEQGVHLQVNMNSFTDHYGDPVKKMAESLVDKKMISFLGTDCHHIGHIGLTEKALCSPKLNQLIEDNCLLNSQILP